MLILIVVVLWVVEGVCREKSRDGGNTVPGDRVLFVLMSVALRKASAGCRVFTLTDRA